MAKQKSKPKPRKSSKPLTRRKSVEAANQRMTEHFIERVQDIENRVGQSNKQLFQNQQMMNNGLAAAEEHVGLIRRVLNDALCGITRVTTITRPVSDPSVSGMTEEVQVVDWNWYTAQLRAVGGAVSFFHEILAAERRDEAKKRTEMVAKFLRKQDVETLTSAIEEEAKMRELVQPVVQAVGWTPQLFEVLRQIAGSELRLKKPPSAEPESKSKLKKDNDPEAVAVAQKELLDEFKEISELAGDAIKAIEVGDEVSATEAVSKLENAGDKRLEESREAIQDFPDGAHIFGGKQ